MSYIAIEHEKHWCTGEKNIRSLKNEKIKRTFTNTSGITASEIYAITFGRVKNATTPKFPQYDIRNILTGNSQK